MAKVISAKHYLAGLFFFFFAFFFAFPGWAESPEIQNIRISTSSNYLNLRFSLIQWFTQKMEKTIQSGIPIKFNYYITLAQQRSWKTDKVLAQITISKTLKYDNLKNEYLIFSNKNNGENHILKATLPTLSEAKKILSEVEILSIYPLWQLERNRTYYFSIKADACGEKPPPYIRYLLFFVNEKYFESNEKIEKFRY